MLDLDGVGDVQELLDDTLDVLSISPNDPSEPVELSDGDRFPFRRVAREMPSQSLCPMWSEEILSLRRLCRSR